MKITKSFRQLLMLVVIPVIALSCSEGMKQSGSLTENSLKSVSTYAEFEPVQISDLKTSLNKINTVIAEIGYPGAGYTLWSIENPDIEEKYMVEGNWPDQKSYDIIHQDERYTKALEAEQPLWDKLSRSTYDQFSLLK